jgi:hypothetical protein
MKQHWFRGTATAVPGVPTAALAGRLMGDSGWSLSGHCGPPRFEDIWQAGGGLPETARRAIEAEPRFAGLEIVLGLAESGETDASGAMFMLGRAGDCLVGLLAVDAGHVGGPSLEAHLADVARRAQRFCAGAAILIVQSTDRRDAFEHFVGIAAAHGVSSVGRGVLFRVWGAGAGPLFVVWIEGG